MNNGSDDILLIENGSMDGMQIIAVVTMLIISILGIAVNIYCFVKMFGRERFRTIFHLLNRARMVSNTVILAVFLIWVVPCTILNRLYLPHIFNQFFGQMAGWGAYWMGPATQICISITRFIAAYFPFFYRNLDKPRNAVILIVLCTIYCAVLFGIGMRDGCSFEYFPDFISFLPNGVCAMGFDTFINISFAGFFVITTLLNLATGIRIYRILRQVASTNDTSTYSKEKRNRKILTQNTIENFLYFFDTFVIKIPVPWYDEEWYQFVINTAIWQGHVLVDGLIMLAYNKESISSSSSRSGVWVSTASKVQPLVPVSTRSSNNK